MPSRPVLIGRGLVPHTHHHNIDTHDTVSATRPLRSSQPTNPVGNTRNQLNNELGNTPNTRCRVRVFPPELRRP